MTKETSTSEEVISACRLFAVADNSLKTDVLGRITVGCALREYGAFYSKGQT